MDRDEKRAGKAIETGIAATSAMVGAVAGTALAAAPVAGVAAAGLLALTTAELTPIVRRRFERRVAQFWASLYTLRGAETPNAAAERLIAGIENEHDEDVITEAFRSLDRLLDPAAIPYVAALTVRYLGKHKPDLAFRRIADLLQQIDEPHLRVLCWLVEAIPPESAERSLDLHAVSQKAQAPYAGHVEIARTPTKPGRDVPCNDIWEIADVFTMLKATTLASEPPAGFTDAITGPNTCIIPIDGYRILSDVVRMVPNLHE